jgi:predicted O-linked N-acetylglucosamine transferase (SPINDLY family)
MNYATGIEPEAVFQTHLDFARLLGPPGPAPALENPDPERSLRIGVVSSDLRSHSVAYFIEPWLAHHDRRRESLTAYSLCPPMSEDRITARLKGYFSEWRGIPALLPHEELGKVVRRDRVDILVDLDGHTGPRLPLFHLRPAPVLVSYLGYANTTGLATMNWRITDSLADPPGPSDALASEGLWRLDPCFLCYCPPERVPEVGPAPEGPFTFGSFNAAAKLSAATLELWGAVLEAVPGSRLLLKGDAFGVERVRADIRARLGAQGVFPDRVDFLGRQATVEEHLGAYGRMHVALDPFPYHGTTTTCEALFMGVPVISMYGRAHASRVGLSLLTAVGLPELAVADRAEFVRTSGALAADPGRLAALRASLRERLLSSPLCDRRGFAARFDGALRSMWRACCGA